MTIFYQCKPILSIPEFPISNLLGNATKQLGEIYLPHLTSPPESAPVRSSTESLKEIGGYSPLSSVGRSDGAGAIFRVLQT